MDKRQWFKQVTALGLALAAPGLSLAGKDSYRGKFGSVSFRQEGNGFLLEVSGARYSGELPKGGLRKLGGALRDGEHKISIDGRTSAYSVNRGKITFDPKNAPPVLEPIPNHVGPAVGVILIILVIYGKWPKKPGKRVVVEAAGTKLTLNPA